MNIIWQTKYKLSAGLLLIGLLSGCATPPKPAECKGQFKPINTLEKTTSINIVDKVVSCNERVKHDNQG